MSSTSESARKSVSRFSKPSAVEGNLRPHLLKESSKQKACREIKDAMVDRHKAVYHKSVFSLSDVQIPSDNHSTALDEITMCRICLSTEDSLTNQLVAPCACSGSLRFVHMQCLKRWRQTKKASGADVSCCELCKHHYNVQLLGSSDVPVDKFLKMQEDLKQLVKSGIYLMLLMRTWKSELSNAQAVASTHPRHLEPENSATIAPRRETALQLNAVIRGNECNSSPAASSDDGNEDYVTRQSLKRRSERCRRKQRK